MSSLETTDPAPPTPAVKPYTIVGSPIHVNKFNDATQSVEGGWQVQAQWAANGSIITVFVPDTADLPSTADTLIRQAGGQLDQLHAL